MANPSLLGLAGLGFDCHGSLEIGKNLLWGLRLYIGWRAMVKALRNVRQCVPGFAHVCVHAMYGCPAT